MSVGTEGEKGGRFQSHTGSLSSVPAFIFKCLCCTLFVQIKPRVPDRPAPQEPVSVLPSEEVLPGRDAQRRYQKVKPTPAKGH